MIGLGIGLLWVLGSGCDTEPPPSAQVPPLSAQPAVERYQAEESRLLEPMLLEVLQFATYAGNEQAHAAQKQWLAGAAAELGFAARDAGPMFEIELPGPPGAEVLGLVVHGDVVEVAPEGWSFPAFEPRVEGGIIRGRGAADDKGPLVQALLAMKALEQSGLARKKTIRLLVGTDEESGSTDVATYLRSNQPPDLSLVLDSAFPVVVGEKAWNALTVSAAAGAPQLGSQPWRVTRLEAGLATSIVPDIATATLTWSAGTPDWTPLLLRLRARPQPEGITFEFVPAAVTLTVTAHGRAAHAGVNLAGGRNALVALAQALDGELPTGTPSCLLGFAKMAGQDTSGTGLDITDEDPVWGRYDVNVATIKSTPAGALALTINVRRIPPRTGPELEQHLRAVVSAFTERTGCALDVAGYFGDEPLVFDRDSPVIARLLAAYERSTGEKAQPIVSGGGTYAKRLPDAIAFGMWFPGRPYPGHDVDESVAVVDLHRGARVLLEALVDLACSDAPLPALWRKT
ncbi:Sapep family Mn(2+)-dependent dipeptidase [Haliangium sp.]|uniref:Sapep family Mn(2+)-dependent dipeptidase n=1 Tax=Haliangium sp. TaxID=2663208 RepID=UPI003D1005E6